MDFTPPISQLPEFTPSAVNDLNREYLPGKFGIEFLEIEPSRVVTQLVIRQYHMAPNGYLHAATVVALADTTCGFASVPHYLKQGGKGFTTIELKTNYLGTARRGILRCEAVPQHIGRTTHIWDATVTAEETGRTIALFRCTQLILY